MNLKETHPDFDARYYGAVVAIATAPVPAVEVLASPPRQSGFLLAGFGHRQSEKDERTLLEMS
jgi:hypothetical protein